MKIKIVEPYGYNKRYDMRSLTPSLGPVVIATLLQQQGHEVEVISEYVTPLNLNDLTEADWVGISLTTFNAERGFEIARHIKQTTIFGGFHASLMPEECLKYGDYVIKGDGYSVLQLAEYLQEGGSGNLDEMPNLVFKREGRIVHTEGESKPVHLVPNFNLVKDFYKMNLNTMLRIPMLANASRGCLHKCSFCCIRKVYRDFKPKDKALVVESIRALAGRKHFLSRFLPRGIWITDDNFFSDLKWAKEILQELAGIQTGCDLILQVRVDLALNKELVQLLKRAGFTRIYLGIESINQLSLDSFEKNTTVQEIEKAVSNLKAYGMEIYALFIFGDDAFQKGDGARVAAFIKRTGISGVLVQPLTPFPGTDLFNKLKSENRVLHERWGEYNGKVVFHPLHLSPAELSEEIYDCYRKVFSPFRILKNFFIGRKGLKLGYLGEGIIRHLEGIKMRRYIRERLIAGEKRP